MHTFELILILLACVIISSPLDQVLKKISLPLVQVAIGFAIALILPEVAHVYVDPELFLVLFIAPLLFNEARESTKIDLWNNKWSILSLAIGLVIITVFVVGFALNLLVPSIPLAAAFACAGALGPTDAAAVSALGSTISLSRRQKTLLSGEALINDASGVVSFQFALAAAITGTFSAAEATGSFLVLFFGGILAGVIFGALAVLSVAVLRRHGFENTVVHVLYEVMTPFVVFLAAEAFHVSGILAVVAAGLIMSHSNLNLHSPEVARQQVLSNGLWEVLVFLINGVLFVLLGMQLPQAISPTLQSTLNLPELIIVICVMTALIIGVRFLWISAIELVHRDKETNERGIAHVARTLKDALVTTIAGPKGAVTLSIIFTIPYAMNDGSPFPMRDLIIFLTSGTILLTLIIANFALPLLAKQESTEDEDTALRLALIAVLEKTLNRIRADLKADEHAPYVPALRLVAARYRTRLFRERMQLDGFGDTMDELTKDVFELQQQRAREIRAEDREQGMSASLTARDSSLLSSIRQSVGYADDGAKVESRFRNLPSRASHLWKSAFSKSEDNEAAELAYYRSCLLAIELERTAIDYLEGVVSSSEPERAEVAQVLANEHQSICESLWGRINYQQDTEHDTDQESVYQFDAEMPADMHATFTNQLHQARMYATEADAHGLTVELEEISHLRANGTITKQQAHKLRENVYLMQMSLEG